MHTHIDQKSDHMLTSICHRFLVGFGGLGGPGWSPNASKTDSKTIWKDDQKNDQKKVMGVGWSGGLGVPQNTLNPLARGSENPLRLGTFNYVLKARWRISAYKLDLIVCFDLELVLIHIKLESNRIISSEPFTLACKSISTRHLRVVSIQNIQ